jgi:hypothetical protein
MVARTSLGGRLFRDAEYVPRAGRRRIANSKNRRGATEAPATLVPAGNRPAPLSSVGPQPWDCPPGQIPRRPSRPGPPPGCCQEPVLAQGPPDRRPLARIAVEPGPPDLCSPFLSRTRPSSLLAPAALTKPTAIPVPPVVRLAAGPPALGLTPIERSSP